MTLLSGQSEATTSIRIHCTFVCALLGIWGAPVLASSGVSTHQSDQPTPKLTFAHVNHGTGKSGIIESTVPTSEEMPGKNHSDKTATGVIDLAPRIETIIRQVFENSPSAEKPSTDLINIEVSEIAPLASSNAMPSGPDMSEPTTRSESVTTSAETDSADVQMQLPGVNDADLLKFRRQMYRTDI